MCKFFIALVIIFLSNNVIAKEIIFEIPAGTKDELKDWNNESQPVVAVVGDTLVIKNLDAAPHRLHTDGRPCEHGDLIEPNGGTWKCVLTEPYNAFEEKEPTRDHFNYDLKFWIIVNPH